MRKETEGESGVLSIHTVRKVTNSSNTSCTEEGGVRGGAVGGVKEEELGRGVLGEGAREGRGGVGRN